jgi:uncharacterized protein YndB with AHSA1/START domain
MTTDPRADVVAVTRRMDAPAATIFAVLCDPATHVAVDGSGMLRASTAGRVTAVDDSFAVEMHNDEMGDYEMTNVVVELEPNRLIRWQPTMTRASRPEDQEDVGKSAEHRWGYELTPVSDAVTEVTHTFDCSDSPDALKRAVRGGERWIPSMAATLEKLALRVEAAAAT